MGLSVRRSRQAGFRSKIYIIERQVYVAGVMAEARKLVGGRLQTFVDKAVEVLAREPVFGPGRQSKAPLRAGKQSKGRLHLG